MEKLLPGGGEGLEAQWASAVIVNKDISPVTISPTLASLVTVQEGGDTRNISSLRSARNKSPKKDQDVEAQIEHKTEKCQRGPLFCCLSSCCFIVILITVIAVSASRSTGGGGGSYAQTGGGFGGGGVGCFPGDSMVEILDLQYSGSTGVQVVPIFLRDLKVGDKVRSGVGFSTVYAFGTKTVDKNAPMLRFDTANGAALDTTMNHFVPTYQKDDFSRERVKLAADVVIGDYVKVLQPGHVNLTSTTTIAKPYKDIPRKNQHTQIISISKVTKEEGLFHPLTHDGYIVVDGVVASVHAVDDVVPSIELFGRSIVGIQAFQQILYSPLRILCHLSPEGFCSELHHDVEDGSHHYLNVVEPLLLFLLPEASRDSQLYGGRFENANFLDVTPNLSLRMYVLSCLLGSVCVEMLLTNLRKVCVSLVMAYVVLVLLRSQCFEMLPDQIPRSILSRTGKHMKN